jgi:hypothetical protein
MTEYSYVRWEVDNSGILRELDRISRGISHRLGRELSFLLEQAYNETQRVVHQPPRRTKTYVSTGSLKASGKVETSTNQRRSATGQFASGYDWEGSIAYGGEAPGAIHPIVDYAIFEAARGTDETGDHDFMTPVEAFEPLFEAAILDWYDDSSDI